MSLTTSFEVLDAAACEQTLATVHQLKREWTRRAPFRPFFTLGAPSYLDGQRGQALYLARAQATNRVLLEHFTPLLQQVAEGIADFTLEQTLLDDRLAVPGFHIFQSHPAFTQPVASQHYDLQYQLVPWDHLGTPDFTRLLSFTLPLRLPEGGGGLFVWDHTYFEHEDPDAIFGDAFEGDPRPQFIPYAEGHLVIHRGHQLHQIAPFPAHRAGDERTSLQGHAVYVDGRYVLYW